MFNFLPLLFLLFSSICGILGFTFDFQVVDPLECGQASISWTGGEPPFSLVIIPEYDFPTTREMGSSTFNSNTGIGNFVWTVNYPANTSFVAMMSDNTGIGTGGVSPLYTVQPNYLNETCTIRYPAQDFQFQLNETSLTQCQPVNISWPTNSFPPVSLVGVIPGGQAFPLVTVNSATKNITSLVWNTNILASTQILLAAFDHGPYGNGGSSKVLTIGSSSDSSCLNDLSPSSTVSSDGSYETGETSTDDGGGAVKTVTAISDGLPKGGAGLSTGAIIGIVIVAVLIAITCQFLLFWFCCKKQIKQFIKHRREMKFRTINLDRLDDSVDLGLIRTHTQPGRNSTSSTQSQAQNIRRRSINSRSTGGVQEHVSQAQDDTPSNSNSGKLAREEILVRNNINDLNTGQGMNRSTTTLDHINTTSPFEDSAEVFSNANGLRSTSRDDLESQYVSSIFGRQGSINSLNRVAGSTSTPSINVITDRNIMNDNNRQDHSSTSTSNTFITTTQSSTSHAVKYNTTESPNTTPTSTRPLLSKSQIAEMLSTMNPDPNINQDQTQSVTNSSPISSMPSSTNTRVLTRYPQPQPQPHRNQNQSARNRPRQHPRELRIHQDAGRVEEMGPFDLSEEEVEELPPSYDPQWGDNRQNR